MRGHFVFEPLKNRLPDVLGYREAPGAFIEPKYTSGIFYLEVGMNYLLRAKALHRESMCFFCPLTEKIEHRLDPEDIEGSLDRWNMAFHEFTEMVEQNQSSQYKEHIAALRKTFIELRTQLYTKARSES